MNKKTIGTYLRELREGKEMLREELANLFCTKFGIEISTHAISEWEHGNTIPAFENIEILSEIYEKNIEEILVGQDQEDIDFDKIYLSSRFSSLEERGLTIVLSAKEGKHIKALKKFKELLKKLIDKKITIYENNELNYIFETFLEFSEYGLSLLQENQQPSVTLFKILVAKIANNYKDENFEELQWEIGRIYSLKREIYDFIKKEIIEKYLSESENWEKDALLCLVHNRFNNFDNNDSYKNCVKTLINNGACINTLFNYKPLVFERQCEIVPMLEGLYFSYYKPLLISTLKDDGDKEYYEIENNITNRFMIDYSEEVNYLLENPNLSIDDIKNIIFSTKPIDDQTYLKLAEKNNINVNCDDTVWKKELNIYIRPLIDLKERFNEMLHNEKNDKQLYNELLEKLEKGEKYFIYKHEKRSNSQSIEKLLNIKNLKSYNEFNKSRNYDLTIKLLNDLENLTFEEIKTKYFMGE